MSNDWDPWEARPLPPGAMPPLWQVAIVVLMIPVVAFGAAIAWVTWL